MFKNQLLIMVILTILLFFSCEDSSDSGNASLDDITLMHNGEQNISKIITQAGDFARSASQKDFISSPDVLSLIISNLFIWGE